jgi:predicted ATPase
MFIHSLEAKNVLSFGPSGGAIELKPLNILIGPNGSGKSNLIDIISLLQALPRDITVPIREGGGIRDWIWKGAMHPYFPDIPGGTPCIIEVVTEDRYSHLNSLRYSLHFTEKTQRFDILDETLNDDTISDIYGTVDSRQSAMSRFKGPIYPEITHLGNTFGNIRIYRNWSFGRHTPLRQPQKSDLPNIWLEENFTNLGLVLNRLQQNAETKKKFLKNLNALYDGIDDYGVNIEGGTVQVFFHEGRFTIPATRLSDGTLRYLCLLAILCNPTPPPLVCIEEPELGLHPDVLSTLAELMIEASQKTQLIVTTHSSQLVDKFTDSPDSVIVCEKHEGATTMKRLDKDALSAWLKDYSLGEVWSMGEIGGNRW